MCYLLLGWAIQDETPDDVKRRRLLNPRIKPGRRHVREVPEELTVGFYKQSGLEGFAQRRVRLPSVYVSEKDSLASFFALTVDS